MRVPNDKMRRLVALVISLVLLITLAFPIQAAASTDTTLETVYPFDGNADSTDGSANGTVSGTPVYKDGTVGQAISLDGSTNFVTLPSNHTLSTYDSITLSTWVNWKGGKDWQRIFDFGTGTTQYMFLTPKTGNYMRFAIKNGGTEQIVQTTPLAIGQWVHVALTLGSGKANLYMNGELKATANVTIKPSDFKPSKNYIGKSQFSDPLFNGLIDEFRIYNRALSADEIKAVYNKSSFDSILNQAQKIIDKGQQYYSDETWNKLLEVYGRAQALRADPSATQAAIDAMAAELLAAIQGLAEPLPTFINNTGMQLVHPAISSSPQELLRVRQHILNKDQPWYGYYTNFAANGFASKSYTIRNDNNPSADFDHLVPNYSYDSYSTSLFNGPMTQDATAAYYQAIMYFMTGDPAYRTKAMRIVLLWGSLDPSKAKYVTDAHIHQGPPMYYMNAAAELLRYTSTGHEDLKWKDAYSQKYSDNFQKPALSLWMENNTNWLNQHQTSVMATLSSYVFMDSKADYERVLEWATVNASTPPQFAYQNGAIANAMFEFSVDSNGNVLDKPVVAVKEMVRDQPHSFDNIEGLAHLADIISAQGTLLDPVGGIATTAGNGVDVYSFLNDRLIKGVNTYYKYNLGYDVPFNDGLNNPVSPDRRGRLGAQEDFYYIYKYGKGYTDNNPDFKYVAEAMNKYWEIYGLRTSDMWLYIPDGALGTHVPAVIAQENGSTVPYQFETHVTALDSGITRTNDSIRIEAAESGSLFAVPSVGIWRNGDLAIRIKSNAITTLKFQRDIGKEPFATVHLPDTGGEWKYVIVNLARVPGTDFQADSMIYFNVSGKTGEYVEFDHLLVNSITVKAPLFNGAVNELHLDSYTSAQLQVDLSNSASNAGQSITYSIVEDSAGFVSNANMIVDSNGVLSGNIPASTPSGDYSFFVTATNGTAINLLAVTISVTGSYRDAIENVIRTYDPAKKYETASYTVFRTKYEAALALAESGDAVAQNQALLDLKAAVSGLRLLNPLISDGALDLTGIAVGAPDSSGINMGSLVDLNASGIPIRWIVDQKQFTMDFGEGFKVKPSEFRMMPDSGFPARSEGAIILASNDYTNWVRISDEIPGFSTDWSTYTVNDEYKNTGFRYFRMKDLTSGVLNKDDYTEDQPFTIADLHIFGERFETGNVVKDINLKVQNALPVQDIIDIPPRAAIGDKVILTFKADQPISNVRATIQGETVGVTDNNDGSYTAEYVVHAGSKSGYAEISIDYNFADGTPAYTVYTYPETFITNANKVQVSQKVLVSNTSNEINVTAESQLSGSDNTLDATETTYLFDGKISTVPDVRSGGGGYGYYNLDFGASNSNKLMQLDRMEILDRSGLPGRAGAVSLSASDDGVNWKVISETSKGYNYDIWQPIKVKDQFKDYAFRYFRIYGGNWYGNISELRMFGKVGEDLKRYNPTFTITTTASDPAAGTTLVYVNPTGLPPAPEPTGNEGSSLTVQGDQTAVVVVAKPAPGYEFVKWVEPTTSYDITADYLWTAYPVFNLTTYAGGYLGGAKTYNVVRDWNLKAVFKKIDWTAPVTTATASPAEPDGPNGWYAHPVSVTLNTYDELSGVAKTEYSLDDGATWQTYVSAITLGQDGKYTVSYRSADNADNVEAVKTISFNLDTTAPTITVSGLVYGTHSDSLDITPILTLGDNLSGVDSSKMTVTVSTYGVEQTVQQGAAIPLYTLPLGRHTLIVTASDMAGNMGSQTILFQTTASIQSLQALTSRFKNAEWIDNAGIANSLQSKLAANDLADFVGEVQAQSGKHISAQAAGYLLRDAQFLLSKQ
ncbi:LamG domain-containing protein [Paenibacillus sp. Soil787]|uniref:LamG domain-containing protein n=1 Tax=Paenibacillus sp. Soil787 TaxID=1736411 RepID=UPI0006F60513|nr:LamG domain-containing protein [Paenibacillus sp. Soil787]KRF42249.1 hypothetical protein ASG93_21380 [Paenibacillus sp. Soil787]